MSCSCMTEVCDSDTDYSLYGPCTAYDLTLAIRLSSCDIVFIEPNTISLYCDSEIRLP